MITITKLLLTYQQNDGNKRDDPFHYNILFASSLKMKYGEGRIFSFVADRHRMASSKKIQCGKCPPSNFR